MPGSEQSVSVPRRVRDLVLSYLNTSQVMGKLWFYAMAFLAAALPLGFYGAGSNSVEALVNGVGFWIILGILSRLAVFEFRQLRAGWVARRIRHSIRAGGPEWDALLRWIGENNDGNFLNTILKKLGVSSRSGGLFAAPPSESLGLVPPRVAEMADGLFERLVPSGTESSRTYVFTTTKTQMLNDDGEWVTVDSSTSSDGGVAPDAALRQALALLEETGASTRVAAEAAAAARPPGAIPLSGDEDDSPRASAADGRPRRARPHYLPLELDANDPAEDEQSAEPDTAEVGTAQSRRGA